MVILRILVVLLLLVSTSFAATDNGDGTRTFTVGSGDFATLATVIYGHPVGVTPGDTLSGQGTTFDEDMTVNGEGLSGSPITITRIRANSFTSANAYVKLAYVIATSGTSCITISGASNEVYNATIVSCTNGVTHSVNTTIKNSIFSDTTTDIETTGGTATVSNNIAHTTDAKFVSSIDYRLRPGSPAINAGTDVGLTTDYLGKPIRGLPDIGAYEFQSVGGGLGMGIIYGF